MKCHCFPHVFNRISFAFAVLFAVATAGLIPQRAAADVSASVSIWHGYDFFYPNLALSDSGPAPATFHWMENESGKLWRQFGSTNGANNFFLTNNLNAVIHECTNGLWKLYLNRGHASEQLYYFKMSITGVTTNVLGNVTIFSPVAGSNGVTNRPTFHWVGPSNFPNVSVQANHDGSGNSYFATLPGTTTNWTPSGTLTTGPNTLFANYFSNSFPGITFTTPTNSSGVPLADWSADGDLHTYLFSSFTVSAAPGGGNGGTILFGHYRFDNASNLRLDSSGLGNDATSTLYVSGGTQFPQFDPNGVAGGAVEFDGYNALFWQNGLTNLLRGSYSISLWLQTTETYGEDDDSPFVGASIVDGGSSIPMVQTGSKLAFHTANGSHTIYSGNSINSGDFEHLVVTRDAATGEKRIYVNGVLDTSGFGPTGSLPAPTQVRLGHSFSGGLDIEGLVDDLQVYTNVLTAAQVQFLFDNPGTTAPNPAGGHTLEAHYRFDNVDLGLDSSPHGRDINASGIWGSPEHESSTDSVAGSGAVEFYGVSSMDLPTSLFPTLAGSFSVSAWIKTSQVEGNDDDDGFDGAGVIWAELSRPARDVAPLVLTGYKAAFFTGDPVDFFGDTLHSAADVSDTGDYVHVVVTRDMNSGEKKIYVNGTLDATGSGYVGLLNDLSDEGDLRFGGVAGNSYEGLLDDVQFYSGILNATEVAMLYANPGTTIPDTTGGGNELADAVDAPDLVWTTGGDANWFAQTAETYDGTDAAQSGSIDHNEESWLQTTVQGPGTFSFWWNISSDDSDGYDYMELTVDGSYESEISGQWGWDYYEVNLDAGPHTLRWTYYKDDDYVAGEDAAWLDEVTFIPSIEVGMSLIIERSTDPENTGFFAYPSASFISPAPITSHEIESPNAMFSYFNDGTDIYSSHPTLPTLQEVIDELEDGDWRIYINRGHPTERQYNFTVTVSALGLTNLPPVNITSPTEWQTGIATNHTFTWTGPTNYDSLFLYSYLTASGNLSGGFTNLAPDLTSTRMPNPLMTGSNTVYVNYTLDNYPGVEISEPLNGTTPLASWFGQVTLISSHTRRFIVESSSPPATPVEILSPLHTGTNFSLSFLTQAGKNHTVQTRTNLSNAPWLDLTNFIGNGSSIQLFLPIGTSEESYFRVNTQ